MLAPAPAALTNEEALEAAGYTIPRRAEDLTRAELAHRIHERLEVLGLPAIANLGASREADLEALMQLEDLVGNVLELERQAKRQAALAGVRAQANQIVSQQLDDLAAENAVLADRLEVYESAFAQVSETVRVRWAR